MVTAEHETKHKARLTWSVIEVHGSRAYKARSVCEGRSMSVLLTRVPPCLARTHHTE